MRNALAIPACCLLLCLLPLSLKPQILSVDVGFNPSDTGWGNGDGPSGLTNRITVASDGSLFIAGIFNQYNGIPSRYLAKLLPNGQLDLSFPTGNSLIGQAKKILIQPDGKVLVAGSLFTYDGDPIMSLIRLLPDGSLDPDFWINPGPYGADVNDMVLMDDGRILICGSFTMFHGYARNGVARLWPDGSVDSSFNPGSGPQLESMPGPGETVADWARVFAMALLPDGKILVGGRFHSFSGQARTHVIRLNANGSPDLTFNAGIAYINDIGNAVSGIQVQNSGKIILAGSFSLANQNISNIFRVHPNGVTDNTFGSGVGTNSSVWRITTMLDGRMVLIGRFITYNSIPVHQAVMIDLDGMIVPTFSTGEGFNDMMHDVVATPEGDLIFVGHFTRYRDVGRTRIAKLDQQGEMDLSFNQLGTGINRSIVHSTVTHLHQMPAGKFLVGGSFTAYNNTLRNTLIRLNDSGVLDLSFNAGGGARTSVNALATDAQGRILVGGRFDGFDTVAAMNLIRLGPDGAFDPTFYPVAAMDATVYALLPLANGSVVVGGGYSPAGPAIAILYRTDEFGAFDNTFNAGSAGFTSGWVNALLAQPNGKILVAGQFFTYNGVSRRNILRLESDGTLDNSFSVGTGFSHRVHAISLQPDGKVLACGEFISYNGTAVSHVVRLMADGTLDPSFVAPEIDGTVLCLVRRPDGKIFIGGEFDTVGGEAYSRLALLNEDGSLDTDIYLGTGFNGHVTSMLLDGYNKMVVGGHFTAFNGIGRNRILRLSNDLVTDVYTLDQPLPAPYPVPTSGMLYLPDATPGQVRLLSIQGQLISEYTWRSGDASMDIGHVPSGIYVVSYPCQNGDRQVTIVVER